MVPEVIHDFIHLANILEAQDFIKDELVGLIQGEVCRISCTRLAQHHRPGSMSNRVIKFLVISAAMGKGTSVASPALPNKEKLADLGPLGRCFVSSTDTFKGNFSPH